VARYRELSANDPTFESDLAGALTNLGAAHRDLRRTAEAEVVTREAVALYRTLAVSQPKLRPHLASALHNLADYLRNGEQVDEAEASAREAVAILRTEVDADASLGPELAMALAGLAECLRAQGDPVEAVRVARESVQLYRPAASLRPPPQLASALTTLVAGLRAGGRGREALVAAREAVDLFRETSRFDSAWRPALGGALVNHAVCLLETDDAVSAVDAGLEAVAVLNEVVPEGPQYLGYRAYARYILSVALRTRETVGPGGGTALAVAHEAVTDYRRAVAEGLADASALGRALMNRAACHESAGASAAGAKDRREAANLTCADPDDR
jgi:tetratricopeptide (TPR) repeat protein